MARMLLFARKISFARLFFETIASRYRMELRSGIADGEILSRIFGSTDLSGMIQTVQVSRDILFLYQYPFAEIHDLLVFTQII